MSHALFFVDVVSSHLVTLGIGDYLVIDVYFVFVLGIGYYLKLFANTGEEFSAVMIGLITTLREFIGETSYVC